MPCAILAILHFTTTSIDIHYAKNDLPIIAFISTYKNAAFALLSHTSVSNSKLDLCSSFWISVYNVHQIWLPDWTDSVL